MSDAPKTYLKAKPPSIKDRLGRYWEFIEEALPEALDESIPEVQKMFKQVFDKLQGSWKALDPRYKARKTAQGYRPEILRRTDRYHDALTSTTGDSVITKTSSGLKYSISDSLWREHVQWHEGAGRIERNFEVEEKDAIKIWNKMRRLIADKLFKKAGVSK